MKNNNILILLISTLGVGILCAIVASIAFTYYNGGFDDLAGNDSSAALQTVAAENQPSGLNTSAIVEEIQDSANGSGINYLALVQLMQKSQTCNTSLMVLETSMATVQVEPSILDDEQYLADIQAFLEDAETNCKGLGDNEEIADIYPDINKEFSKTENAIDDVIENYQDYFTYKKSKYLEDGNTAYEEAIEQMRKATEMLQETMTE